jgi:hypothetical protein
MSAKKKAAALVSKNVDVPNVVHTYKNLALFYGKPDLPEEVAQLFQRIAPSRKKK